jgi:hypothetical protein
MTLDEFKQTPEFDACSDKVKLWLVTAIENGFDYTAATRAAFTAKDPQKFSYAVRNWPAVQAALNVWRGMSPFDIWFGAAQKAGRSKKTSIAQIQALKMQADAMGWNAEGLDRRLHGRDAQASAAGDSKPQPVAPAPRRSRIGMVIPYGTGWVKVTTEDENGQPTNGDLCTADGTHIPQATE